MMHQGRYMRLTLIVALLGGNATLFAQETTSTLPKGIWRFWAVGATGRIGDTYGDNGNRQGLAHSLNTSVPFGDFVSGVQSKIDAGDLSGEDLETAQGLVDLYTELESYGEVIGENDLQNKIYQADILANATVGFNQFVPALEYGLTSKISLGVKAPIAWIRGNANTGVSNQSNIDAVKNLTEGSYLEDGVQSFSENIDAVNDQVLLGYLATLDGYGYSFSDHQAFGLSDVELGAKYRFFETTYLDIAYKGGLRLPTTSHTADPRFLLDQSTGDDQMDVGHFIIADFKPLPNLYIGTAVQFTFQLADKKRMPVKKKDSEFPLADLNDPDVYGDVWRNLGDKINAELSVRYSFGDGRFEPAFTYLYSIKESDSYSGTNDDLDYESLEANTKSQNHAFEVSIALSTIPDFRKKRFPIPLQTELAYHKTIAGRNSSNSEYGLLKLKVYF